MSDSILRRGFLRQLCALPMLGGGVALLGAPTAVAEPVTPTLIKAYADFLVTELNLIHEEMPPRDIFMPRPAPQSVSADHPLYLQWARETLAAYEARNEANAKRWAIRRAMPVFSSPASTRAALVLSTVGFDWRG
jgi:hypothetical protein